MLYHSMCDVTAVYLAAITSKHGDSPQLILSLAWLQLDSVEDFSTFSMENISYHWLLRLLSFSLVCASIGQLINSYFALQFCQELQELDVHKIASVCGVVSLLAGSLFLICSICILFQLIFSKMNCFCNLCTFFSISGLFMVTLATLGGLTVVLPLALETDVGPNIKELIRVYRGNKTTYGIDYIQDKLKCCGVQSYTDWVSSFHGRVPRSCCINDVHCSFKGTVDQMKPYVHKIDCPKAIQEHFYGHFFNYMLGGTVCTMIAFMFCLLVTCLMMNNAKPEEVFKEITT